MPKQSRKNLQIEKSAIIDAPIEKVSLLFDDAIGSWYQIPGLNGLVDVQLYLQHELGGQLYACGKTRSGNHAQEVLGHSRCIT